MTIQFDAEDLADTRRRNARLARMPRVRLHGIGRHAVQSLINFAGLFVSAAFRREGVAVENRRVSALGRSTNVMILRPPGPIRGVYLEIHGGGWTIGRAYTNGKENVAIAKECGVAVVAVDYRLAPGVPFAEVLDDCETAARWLAQDGLAELGADRFVIGGDSAGGHLAAITTLRLRDGAGADFAKLVGAVLIYGCFDLGGSESIRNAPNDTLLLHGPSLIKTMDVVTGMSVEARRDAAYSPLFAKLDHLPPALMIVGTADPLIDDSTLMHAKWQAASGNAELAVVPEACHGFNHFEGRAADKANAYIRRWITARFAATQRLAAVS